MCIKTDLPRFSTAVGYTFILTASSHIEVQNIDFALTNCSITLHVVNLQEKGILRRRNIVSRKWQDKAFIKTNPRANIVKSTCNSVHCLME